LDRREREYSVFLQKLQRASRNRDPKRARRLSEQWRKHWRALVKSDKSKTEMLTRLHDELTTVGGRPQRLQAARKDIQDVTHWLRVPPKGGKEDLTMLTRQYRQAVLQAKAYPELVAEVEDAQRALGAAQDRLLPKPKPTPKEARALLRARQLAPIEDVSRHLAALAGRDPNNLLEWGEGVAAVRAAVKKAHDASKALGKMVGLIAERGISAEQSRPRPRPAIRKVTYHSVPWDAYMNIVTELFRAKAPLRRLWTEADNNAVSFRAQAAALRPRKKGPPMSPADKKRHDEFRKKQASWEARRKALDADIEVLNAHNRLRNDLKNRYLKESTP
jgi:hypothetical protein